ncbi:FISUMP domain-containing protein [Fibrobacter sp.]|uniref:FISUMP domain-containing protein n=1 Tax=Fibrobacter sp. TaxID=35828 RepID=UPI00388D6D3D
MKKNILFAMLCFGAFFVGCDDSSSASADSQGLPSTETTSSDSANPDEPTNLSSGEASDVAGSSSSQVVVDPSTGAIQIPLSSSNDESAEDCFDGNAKITITGVESLNMQCTEGAKGWTIYNSDLYTLYTCDGTQWNDEVVVLCKHEEKPVQDVPATYGTLTDARDGQTYKTIEIGEQTWMAENLNYESNTSYCYQNSLDSCDKYGRLYTYNEADTVCPEGYRLPTKMDFDNLLRPLSETVYDERLDWHYNLIELSIKATTDWVPDTTTYVNENGELTHLPDATNSSGYTLLPAGYMKPNGGFYGAGKDTYLWSSADGSDAGTKYAMELEYRYDGVTFYWWELDYAFSVRCVKK